MKRIVLLGDSLGMPRPPDVAFEETYPYLISKRSSDFMIIPRFSRARDTKFQSSQQQINDDILWLSPDVVVVHLGIVDCAPRLFRRSERFFLSLFPILVQKAIINYVSRHRFFLTKLWKKVYVTKKDFLKNMEAIVKEGKLVGAHIVIVGIVAPPKHVRERSFGFLHNVDAYNATLLKIAKDSGATFVDANNILNPCEHLCADGIHLNKEGNQLLANELIKKISRYV